MTKALFRLTSLLLITSPAWACDERHRGSPQRVWVVPGVDGQYDRPHLDF